MVVHTAEIQIFCAKCCEKVNLKSLLSGGINPSVCKRGDFHGRPTVKLKSNNERTLSMKESIYKHYDELPLFLNAKIIAEVLGVSPATSYELLHESGFPSLKIGNRIVVPKEQFIQWVEQHIAGGDS